MLSDLIPPFYVNKSAQRPGGTGLTNVARTLFLKRKEEEVKLDEKDFNAFFKKLGEVSTPQDDAPNLAGKCMTFETFLALGKDADVHPVFRKLFTPTMYFAFPKNYDGFVFADPIFSCVVEMRENRKIRFELVTLDEAKTGYLNEMQLVRYFDQFFREIPDDHIDFYVAVVVRKFMFFLEHEKRVAIRDLMASPILTEFKQRHVLQDSWFHSRNVYGLYNKFVELDSDRNMLLNQQEFMRLSFDFDKLPRITPLIVDRVFAKKNARAPNNPNAELDFRNFLDFVLAFQSRQHPASIKYFWELLDANDLGYLTAQDVLELIRAVFDTLGLDVLHMYVGGDIKAEDVKDEVFDMANGGGTARITFDDLIKCGHGGTIVTILTDPSGFLTYEQREYQLQQAGKEQTGEGAESGEYSTAATSIFGGSSNSASGSVEDETAVAAAGPTKFLNIGQDEYDEEPQPLNQTRSGQLLYIGQDDVDEGENDPNQFV